MHVVEVTNAIENEEVQDRTIEKAVITMENETTEDVETSTALLGSIWEGYQSGLSSKTKSSIFDALWMINHAFFALLLLIGSLDIFSVKIFCNNLISSVQVLVPIPRELDVVLRSTQPPT